MRSNELRSSPNYRVALYFLAGTLFLSCLIYYYFVEREPRAGVSTTQTRAGAGQSGDTQSTSSREQSAKRDSDPARVQQSVESNPNIIVIDDARSPIANARVYCIQEKGRVSRASTSLLLGATDSNGGISVGDRELNELSSKKLTFIANGYCVERRPVGSFSKTPTFVTLHTAEKLQIQCVDTSYSAIPNISVLVSRLPFNVQLSAVELDAESVPGEDPGTAVYVKKTDSTGTATFDQLAPGKYVANIFSKGNDLGIIKGYDDIIEVPGQDQRFILGRVFAAVVSANGDEILSHSFTSINSRFNVTDKVASLVRNAKAQLQGRFPNSVVFAGVLVDSRWEGSTIQFKALLRDRGEVALDIKPEPITAVTPTTLDTGRFPPNPARLKSVHVEIVDQDGNAFPMTNLRVFLGGKTPMDLSIPIVHGKDVLLPVGDWPIRYSGPEGASLFSPTHIDVAAAGENSVRVVFTSALVRTRFKIVDKADAVLDNAYISISQASGAKIGFYCENISEREFLLVPGEATVSIKLFNCPPFHRDIKIVPTTDHSVCLVEIPVE